MKVLFDTNVYISEALVGGLAEKLINATRDARWRIFVSRHLDETERVLCDSLNFSRRFAAMTPQRLRRRAEPVEVPGSSRHRVPNDPEDSPVLQAAISAGVDYLVTNDRHLAALDPYESVRIVSMQQFSTVLHDHGLLPRD